MADFGNALKKLTNEKPLVWLADTQPRNPKTYEWLAQPDTLAAVKAAGVKHLFVDMPEALQLTSDFYKSGMYPPGQLTQEVGKSVGYGMSKTGGQQPPSPETIAKLIQNAHEQGISLRFIGDPQTDALDGKKLAEEAERAYQNDRKGDSPLKAFAEALRGSQSVETDRLKKAREALSTGSGLGSSEIRSRLDALDRHLHRVVDIVQSETAEGRALILHQGINMPTTLKLDELMGGEGKVGRIDVGQPQPRSSYDMLLPQAVYAAAPVLNTASNHVRGMDEPVYAQVSLQRPAGP